MTRLLLAAAYLVLAAVAAGVVAPTRLAAQSSGCTPSPTVPGVTEGSSQPGTVAPSRGTLRAVLLLVHAADVPPDDSTAGPGRMFAAASAWFRDVSYGRLDFHADTLHLWLPLPAPAAEYESAPERYLRDAVEAADPYVDFSTVDVVYIAPASGTPETRTSAILNSFGVRADGREIRFWVPWGPDFASPENTGAYFLLHETGHLLGLPDLYVAAVPTTFHRWDLMAARYPSELLAWHRWKLGWLDARQIVCITGRATRVATLTPLERPGGLKAVFVARGRNIYAVEVRSGATLCERGVLVYTVDQSQFKRAPVRIYQAQTDRDPPQRDCGGQWNAPFDVGRNESRVLRLTGLRVDVIRKLADGRYRVRVTAG